MNMEFDNRITEVKSKRKEILKLLILITMRYKLNGLNYST